MIFFDVDTQHDFMDADGALAVLDAAAIKPQIERLLRAASNYGITTISSQCAHEAGDAEFEIFPPHCLAGTPGAERIFAALPALPCTEIAVSAAPDAAAVIEAGRHYEVQKKVYDLFSNAWLNDLRVRGAFTGQDCVVFGVATDYCVRAAALGLAQAGARVTVVSDAIRGVAPDTTEQTLTQMRAASVKFMTTDEVLNNLTDEA